jgi:hypothetical protein
MPRFFLVCLLLVGLAGCSGVSEEGGLQWTAPAAGGGSSSGSTTVTAPAQPVNVAPLAAPLAAQIEPDLSNIPGVQEVHYMTSEQRCRNLFNKLLKQGVGLTDYKFFKSNMPGDPEGGNCRLKGPGTIANRFAVYQDK